MATREFGPYRVTPGTKRRPTSPPWPPTYSVSRAVHECLRSIERDDEQLRGRRLDGRAAKRLAERALARNAWGTASIEGNPMSQAEVQSLLARQATPDSIELPTEREILNTAALLERLETWKVPREPKDLLKLHKVLMKGVLPDAGEFKRVANFIGRRADMTVVYVATPPARVERELAAALAWAHHADEHPLVRAFLAFHEVQAIHPFRDGNGRVGRALLAIMLHAWGYPGVRLATMDAAFNEDREGYYGALAAAEASWDRTPWLAYVAGIARDTFREAAQLAALGQELPASLNARQAGVAEWFATRPARALKFADVHAAFPHIAARTLKRDLAALRDAGFLAMSGERRGSAYTRKAPR